MINPNIASFTLYKQKEIYEKINEASEVLKNVCIKTELRELNWLEKITGIKVMGKFENEQITGSFKFRGAYYKMHKCNNSNIIAASAGNHGLAVAEVGKLLGLKTNICIPINASSIKKERLCSYGHSIIQEGDSLEESIGYAKKIASQNGYLYISPFDDEDIIAGQGTLAKDLLEQYTDFDTIIVPVGGGGLISGMAIYIKSKYPKIKIIGVEPQNYNSLNTSIKQSKVTRVINTPTFADGLSVNLNEESITLNIINTLVDEIIEVSEEEIAAATLAILYHESKLVEPSGAISISPILSGRIGLSYGKVGVIFSGGNVSTSNIMKIINYPFKKLELAKFTNYIYPTIDNEIIAKGINTSVNFVSKVTDINDANFITSRFTDIINRVNNFKMYLTEYEQYCSIKGIKTDLYALSKINTILSDIKNTLAGNLVSSNEPIIYPLQKYRSLLQSCGLLYMLLDYRSAAYNQSKDSMFFCLDAQDSPNVNYNRYESKFLLKLENQLSEVLGIDLNKYFLLVTSSGMAAYNLIEGYISRVKLTNENTVIYLPNYIYFETEEQLRSLKNIKIVKDKLTNTDSIIKRILELKPKIVFLDPMTNTVDLEMIDTLAIIEYISKNSKLDISFIIDGTMISGAINVTTLKIRDNVDIFYYESCSKYLQLGLDLSMGGIIVSSIKNKNHFSRLRRNMGNIMYDNSVHTFPFFNRSEHLYRMTKMTKNALIISSLINDNSNLNKEVFAIYPLLENHINHKVAKKLPYIGGIVTFKFLNEYFNQRDILNSCIERILEKAKIKGVSIIKGVSFGFSLPRISAAAAMNELDPPFLRLSVGDGTIEEITALGEVFIESFFEHIKINTLKLENI